MNPATGVVLTTGVVLLGKWARKESVTIHIVAGGTVLAVGLSVLAEASPDLAGKFTLLITLAALFTYAPAIAWQLGLLDHTTYPTAPRWV